MNALAADVSITVLLATRNGAPHLDAQLQSIAAQKGCTWRLIASDDASTDATPEILGRFAKAHGTDRVRVLQGPARGVTGNFRFLLGHAPPGEAVAFSDQDDIWHPDKLHRALSALQNVPEGIPAIYGSTVIPADAAGRPKGTRPSRVPCRPLGLRNALVQNVFPGNTLVLNASAVRVLNEAEVLMRAAGADYVLHDWWVYILVSAVGGRLIFDPAPGLLYRQHGGNLIGTNDGLGAILRRGVAVLMGRNAEWMDRHLAALHSVEAMLTSDSRALLAKVRRARGDPFFARIGGVLDAGLYLQRRRAQLLFQIAVLFGRV